MMKSKKRRRTTRQVVGLPYINEICSVLDGIRCNVAFNESTIELDGLHAEDLCPLIQRLKNTRLQVDMIQKWDDVFIVRLDGLKRLT